MGNTFDGIMPAVSASEIHYDPISSGERVVLIEPGRHIHDLGKAIVTFKNHNPIVVEIVRTSNCRMKDIPLTDMTLFGCHDSYDVLAEMRKWDGDIQIDDEVTIIRFKGSEI